MTFSSFDQLLRNAFVIPLPSTENSADNLLVIGIYLRFLYSLAIIISRKYVGTV